MAIVSDGRGGMGDVRQTSVATATEEPESTDNPEHFTPYTMIPNDAGDYFKGLNFYNPLPYLERGAERAAHTTSDFWRTVIAGNADMYGATLTADDLHEDSPVISADEANKLAPEGAGKMFDQPLPQKLAEDLAHDKEQQMQADSDIDRYEKTHGWIAKGAMNIAAFAADPLNVTAAFIPGFGEEAIAAKFGTSIIGRLAARGISGAALGAIQQAPLEGLKAGLGAGENDDYTIRRALSDTFNAAAFMAIGQIGFGFLGDALKHIRPDQPLPTANVPPALKPDADQIAPVVTASPATQDAAKRTALAQVIQGKPVDVDSFFPKPPGTATSIAGPMVNPHIAPSLGEDIAKPFDQSYRDWMLQTGHSPETSQWAAERLARGSAAEPAAEQFDRDAVARQLAPKLFYKLDALDAERTAAHDQWQQLSKDRAAVPGSDEAVAQHNQQLSDLQDQLGSARNARIKAQIADRLQQLQANPPQAVPSVVEIDSVQQRMQQADYAMRDMQPQLNETYGRADDWIARTQAARTGQRLDAIDQAQKQWGKPIITNPNLANMMARLRVWKELGTAPGIPLEDLQKAADDVKAAAEESKANPPPTPPEKPEGWNAPKAGEGEEGAENPAIDQEVEKVSAAKAGAGGEAAAKDTVNKILPTLDDEGRTAFLNKAAAVIDLTGMGKSMTDNLYEGLYNALKQGKDTFAGIKDPVLAKAKPAFDKGLIKTPDDLRSLSEAGYDETALAHNQEVDTTNWSTDEKAQLDAARSDMQKASWKEQAYKQAASCIIEAGG